jgi:uncharacterized phiE125 gp8 family phage protein
MGIKQTSAPSAEPVTTAAFKSHARIDIDDDDTLVDNLLLGAREHVEAYTRRQLITATWTWELNGFPPSSYHPIFLPYPPLQSITSIKYYDTAGDQQTWSNTLYTVDTKSEPGKVYPNYGEIYPSTRLQYNAVEIIFVAGYGDAGTDLPESILIAMKMLAAEMYERREQTVVGQPINKVSLAAERLLDRYQLQDVVEL